MSGNPETVTNSIGMRFVYIPPCTFVMGSPSDEKERYHDEAQHLVILTTGFHIQTTPVTQKQWMQVMEDNPSYFKGSEEDCPVENVSWYDCQEFIRKLNQKEGTDKYRFPSESEWECVCRAGSKSRFCFGDEESVLEEYAWYYANSDLKSHPAGYKKPNAWGLYDMHGNVWEWCQDWYGDYPSDAVSDPSGPSEGSHKVVRGGAWYFYAGSCRSACRNFYVTGRTEFFLGLRLVSKA
jgi:formylglycine-generating enzyme required for sulfatase activity